jgi:hypothetical protein
MYHRSNIHSSDKINNMNTYSVLINQTLTRHQKATNHHANTDKPCGDEECKNCFQIEHSCKYSELAMNSLKRISNLKQVLTDSDNAYILNLLAVVEGSILDLMVNANRSCTKRVA